MSTRLSLAEGKALLKARKKPSKYRAQRTMVDGIPFDSKREAYEYNNLLNLWGQLFITDLELQPVFELHAPNGEVLGKYIADFRYRTRDGKVVVVDVKGMETLPLARWKQKHLRAEYGITVEERR